MTVAIADDHQLILSSLQEIIFNEDNLELVGKYLTGATLRDGLKLSVPDLLILDYQLPDETGIQLAKYISYYYPSVKIIILTGFNKPGIVNEVLQSGGMGILLKSNTDATTMIEALNRIIEGNIYIDPSLRHNLNKFDENQLKITQLTSREMEILREIAAGLSNNEIAAKLFISTRTVENHRNSIMLKSGSKNSIGLFKLALNLKLIDL